MRSVQLARHIRTTATITSASTPAATTPPLPRVVLKGGKSKLFSEYGSPIVYGGAIDRVVGRPPPITGDLVLVQDGAENSIAWGVWNPDSMFRVRIFDTFTNSSSTSGGSGVSSKVSSISEVLDTRIAQAVALRHCIGLPLPAVTTVYRVCNSEGDGLSGLVVDVLGGSHLVVSSSAAWIERYKDIIIELLKKHTGIDNITWRPSVDMLLEEGWPIDTDTSTDTNSAAITDTTKMTIEVVEHGVKYLADPLGQKTGFYSDQREHRHLVKTLSNGKTVLDLCCFTGGFAINAAVGGATSVTGVDSSAPALELAAQNATLNGLNNVDFIKSDASSFMKTALLEGKKFDIVILDPPKLAPNKKALQNALRKYKALNQAAMQLVSPGGLLMTCSCSGAVSQGDVFLPMLVKASKGCGRSISVLREGGAAADHPLSPTYPEGKYLTNVLLRVV